MDTGTQHEVQHVLKLQLLFHSHKNHKNVISTTDEYIILKTDYHTAEMAQSVRELASILGDMRSIPGTHMRKREN